LKLTIEANLQFKADIIFSYVKNPPMTQNCNKSAFSILSFSLRIAFAKSVYVVLTVCEKRSLHQVRMERKNGEKGKQIGKQHFEESFPFFCTRTFLL